MIDRIIVENFKSLRKVDLSLGRLNLFIGTNASGKSSFLDALRFLQGIGSGFTITEILDGKPRTATSEIWEGIRGGSSNACLRGTTEVTIAVNGTLDEEERERCRYAITFSPSEGQVIRERFGVGDVPFDTPVRSGASAFDHERSVVWQIASPTGLVKCSADVRTAAIKVIGQLRNIQRLDLSVTRLQQYSTFHHVRRLGEQGENFAALVRTICQDARTKSAFLSWLQELRPEEVEDVGTLRGADGDSLFMLRESGREFSARALSEGTLRFAAMTAAFFQPDMPGIMTIEEIENGIHPSRLRLLVELFRSRAGHGETQVFSTTHSPSTLAWLEDADYRTTFVCKRDDGTGESTIRPLTEVPHFKEVAEKCPPSELFAEGWLEAAL